MLLNADWDGGRAQPGGLCGRQVLLYYPVTSLSLPGTDSQGGKSNCKCPNKSPPAQSSGNAAIKTVAKGLQLPGRGRRFLLAAKAFLALVPGTLWLPPDWRVAQKPGHTKARLTAPQAGLFFRGTGLTDPWREIRRGVAALRSPPEWAGSPVKWEGRWAGRDH